MQNSNASSAEVRGLLAVITALCNKLSDYRSSIAIQAEIIQNQEKQLKQARTAARKH